MENMAVWIVFWFFMAAVSAIVASNKGRSVFGWFVLGLLGSLAALVVLIVLPSLKKDPNAPTEETHVKCPHCAEYIKREAIKCKHCGEAVTPQTMAAQPAHAPDPYTGKAERIGATRIGKYWGYGGKIFETAQQVVEHVQNPRP